MWFLSAVVYLSYAVIFMFCTLCVACGLYYLAELVEEYTSLAKRVLRDLILFVLLLHIGMVLFEDLPLSLVLMGVVSHGTYFTLLKRFPYIGFTEPKFLLSCVFAVASHALWFNHFTSADTFYPFSEILAFFLFCVWVVPFGFFVSLSAQDSLPHPAVTSDIRRTPSQQELSSSRDPALSSSGSSLLPGVADVKGSHSVIRRFFDFLTGLVSSFVPSRFLSQQRKAA